MLVRCLLPMCPHTSFLVTPRRLCLLLPPLLLLLGLLFRPTNLLCLESEGVSAMETVCEQVFAASSLRGFHISQGFDSSSVKLVIGWVNCIASLPSLIIERGRQCYGDCLRAGATLSLTHCNALRRLHISQGFDSSSSSGLSN